MNFENASGIYCFENKINNKKYIGQAKSINKRIKQHLHLLKSGNNECIALQHAWTLYGKENFDIYIIEKCDEFILDESEIYYIKKLHSHISENGYNISWGGEHFFRGMHHSEESKKKISENSGAISGKLNPQYGKKLPEETKQKVSQSLFKYYENHDGAMLGKHHSEETKKKMSKSRIGKKHPSYISEDYRKKLSDNWKGKAPWNKGLSMSDEFKKKNSEVHMGQVAWNKGIPHTKEDKIKMSKAHIGILLKEEHKKNISKANLGGKRKNSSSKYMGVCFIKKINKWRASFYYLKEHFYIGSFNTEIEAALAYNKKVLEIIGEDVKLNIFTEEEFNFFI
jgi:group I intron endonuclease